MGRFLDTHNLIVFKCCVNRTEFQSSQVHSGFNWCVSSIICTDVVRGGQYDAYDILTIHKVSTDV